ncbi:MAG: hypothetical protein ABFR36_01335 [Acidobacteriota bacterium]
MNFEYDKFSENNEIIKKETRTTVLICLAMVASVIVYALISYYLTEVKKISFADISPDNLSNIFNIMNIAAIFMVIAVLAIRKTIYYSTKIIKDDFTLIQIIQKWRSIDIVLIAIGESISILGLVISLLGVPFGRTFHFFITSVLVILIIMPMNWKVRDKLRTLNHQRDMNVRF